jgi:hypothetical protein
MVRLARVVAPGIPHHIRQRGNRWQETVFCAEDDQEYIPLTGELKGYSVGRCGGGSPAQGQQSFQDKYGVPRIPAGEPAVRERK